MKATAKPNTASNIKPMAGGVEIATLTGGQYVFGDLSSQSTDIVNFSHYYTADGVKISLPKPCKVFIGNNLILTDEVEGIPEPDPSPVFPESYIMYDPKNPQVKAEYQFVRILE